MTTRRINLQPNEILEILDPMAQSVLKIRVLQGNHGNTQVFVFSQPIALAHLDPTQAQVIEILTRDPQFGWSE
jgi:hypothetical protein